jgi:hypothetical protein
MTRTICLPAALLLIAALPLAADARQEDPPAPLAPAVALPLAAPTGAAEIALIVHWIDAGTAEMYGFAFGRPHRPRGLNVQLAMGQARSAQRGQWIAGGSADYGWRLYRSGGTTLHAGLGSQLLFDRREDNLNLRVPFFARAEHDIVLAEQVILSPLAAGGASIGAARFDEWSEYGGAFAEAGARLSVHGVWLQAGVSIDRGVFGPFRETGDPRYVIRLGFIRPTVD